jgi:hypothetical protein
MRAKSVWRVNGRANRAATAVLPAHRSYEGAGIVLRCSACGDVALRVVPRADDAVFELRGTWRCPIST